MRYFILDDDRTFCLQLQEMLEDAAAEDINIACTIREALQYIHDAARSHRLPDIILCDYRLSDRETGVDFLQALQSAGFDIPAVLLTDLDDENVIRRATERFGAVQIPKTGLETAELVQQISFFAFRRWAEQRRLASAQIRRQASNMLLVGAEIAHEFKSVIWETRIQFKRLKKLGERGDIPLTALDRYSQQLNETLEDGLQLCQILMNYGGEIQGHQLKLEKADLLAEIEAVAKQAEHAVLQVRLASNLDDGIATIDRFVLRRVLSVLFRNIIDHAEGGFNVQVTIGEAPREGGRALFIDVEDDGPGIRGEHRRNIFEAGERGGKQIQYAAGGGLGLGLGFAKALIGLHIVNGFSATIQCLDAVTGTGARFRISLPQE